MDNQPPPKALLKKPLQRLTNWPQDDGGFIGLEVRAAYPA
jgi:hypothetical protein